MIHEIAAQLAAGIRQTSRKGGILRVQQQTSGFQRRGTEKNHAGPEFHRIMRLRINDAHAGDPALAVIVDEAMDDAVRAQSYMTGGEGSRQSHVQAAEISAHTAAAMTRAAVVAGLPAIVGAG